MLDLRKEASAVNQHCTMEEETISKHGRSSKSQKNRVNTILIRHFEIILIITIVISMIACSASSPESDGKKAGKMACDCIKDLSYREFNGECPPTAKMKKAKKCAKKANKKYQKLQEKYLTNKEKLSEFYYAFQQTVEQCEKKQ